MDEREISSMEELTDEELDAISGGYVVDLSEHKGYRWYAFVNDKTGRVIAYTNENYWFKDYEAAKDNSLEVISMDDYEKKFGRKFYS